MRKAGNFIDYAEISRNLSYDTVDKKMLTL